MTRAPRPRPGVVLRSAAMLAAALLLLPAGVSAQRGGGGGGGPGANVVLSPADVVFPTPTELEFDAGWVEHGGVTITVEPRNRNRQNWQLFVQASAADMGGYGKPVQDMLVRAQGATAWTSVATTPTLLAEGTGTGTVTIYYRLLLDWSLDAPGLYSVPLEYTATAF